MFLAILVSGAILWAQNAHLPLRYHHKMHCEIEESEEFCESSPVMRIRKLQKMQIKLSILYKMVIGNYSLATDSLHFHIEGVCRRDICHQRER